MKGNVNKGSLFTSCIMNCSSCLKTSKKKRILVSKLYQWVEFNEH